MSLGNGIEHPQFLAVRPALREQNASWGLLKGLLGPPGASWGLPKGLLGPPGASWGLLEGLLGPLGASWGLLGASDPLEHP